MLRVPVINDSLHSGFVVDTKLSSVSEKERTHSQKLRDVNNFIFLREY